VQQYISHELGADERASKDWYTHWIHEGFGSLEQLAGDGPCVFGRTPTLADALLIPQMYNARRFKVPTDQFAKLVRIVDACNELPAFKKAAPELQPDAA
jgi:glutathione S-transferase